MPPAFEVIQPNVRRGPYLAALFDFDGTLSLIREGWPRVMIGMMVELLRERKIAALPALAAVCVRKVRRGGVVDLRSDLALGEVGLQGVASGGAFYVMAPSDTLKDLR